MRTQPTGIISFLAMGAFLILSSCLTDDNPSNGKGDPNPNNDSTLLSNQTPQACKDVVVDSVPKGEMCFCTMEFRSYAVTVLTSTGEPSATASLVLERKSDGKIISSLNDIISREGMYTIMDDSQVEHLSYTPQKFTAFNPTDFGDYATGDYWFYKDRCGCHFNKCAGPDTLIAQ